MRLISVHEMKELEKSANNAEFPYAEMMSAAGKGIADIVMRRFLEPACHFAVGLAGTGNNGGDTLIALKNLQFAGWQTYCLLTSERDEADQLVQEYLINGGKLISNFDLSEIVSLTGGNGIVLDGIFGTGFHPPLDEKIISTLEEVQRKLSSFTLIAIDCPSGIDAETGAVSPGTMKCDLTICLEAVKQGLMNYLAFPYCGEIECVDLGLSNYTVHPEDSSDLVIDSDFVIRTLPKRGDYSHKGTFGKTLVIGGCVNYPGAPVLAGKGAYAVGTGLVQVAIPGSIANYYPASALELTWLILEDGGGVISEMAVETVAGNLAQIKSIVLGPGISREETTGRFVSALICEGEVHSKGRAGFPGVGQKSVLKAQDLEFPPVVLDADALFHLSKISDWHQHLRKALVLTPHPGEMAMLTGMSVEDVQEDRVGTAKKFARLWNQTVVLKGALTVVASPVGRIAVIPIATSGLAKAGTGDVLAGMIGGLLAQGVPSWQAAASAAWLHGQAGMLAVEKMGGPEIVLASDVVSAMAGVYRSIRTTNLP